MGSIAFQRTESVLHQLVVFQQKGESISSILDVLYYLLDECLLETEQEEWDAIRTAVLVTLRIVSYNAVSQHKWNECGSKVFRVLGVACDRIENTRCSLKWVEHIKPLLSCLLSVTPKDNADVDLFSTGLLKFMTMLKHMQVCWKELGKPESLPIYGALVFACLEIISDRTKNSDSRLNCLKTIHLLVLDDENSNLQGCSTVIPGLLAKLIELSSNPTENMKIIEESLDVITDFIVYGFSDRVIEITEFPESAKLETKSLNLQRSKEWMDIARPKLQSSTSLLISRYCSHRDAIIRQKIFDSATKIHKECGIFFGDTLDDSIFDLILLMSKDPFDSIAESVHKHLEFIKKLKSNSFSKYMYEKMVSLSEKLPAAVRQSTQISVPFNQMSSLISCLGKEFEILLTSRNPLAVQLIRALASTIRIDTNRLSISRSFETMCIREIVLSLPLQFGVEMNDIESVCKVITYSAGEEALDTLLGEIMNSDTNDKIAFTIMSILILESFNEKGSSNPDLISLFAEHFLMEVERISIPQYVRDDKVEDPSQAPWKETILAVTSVCALSSSSKYLSEGATSRKLFINGIYKLLQLVSHPSWLIKDTVEVSIRELAKIAEKDVSEFMLFNAVYIVNKITLAVRSYEHYVEAPLALSAFLDVINDSNTFEHVQYLTKSMLDGLESYNQQWTLGVVRALRSYVRAMNRWFPELMEPRVVQEELPIPHEDFGDDINDCNPVEVESPPLPDTARSVESVLKMTKHLLSSPHIPVQIIVTDILKEGLHFLRNFENALLPMVHQNWLTLIRRFDKEEFDVWRVSILVIHEMAIVSKTFVYQRIKSELWPKLNKWLTKEAKIKNFFVFSSRFKLLETILIKLPDVFISIGFSDEEWEDARLTIETFTEPHIHPQIRSLTAKFLEKVDFKLRKTIIGPLY